MNVNPDLNNLFPYFRKSMNYLMKQGEEFAEKYPAVAKELNFSSNKVSDPHVQRLLESFAFFDARLQYQIEDQMSELSMHLLNALYPQLTAPIPSCTIVQFNKIVNISQKRNIVIPKSTKIKINNNNNKECTFTTTSTLEFNSSKINNIQYIKFDQTNIEDTNTFLLSISITKLTNQNLVLFINSDLFTSFALYENIMAYKYSEDTPVFAADAKNQLINPNPIGYIKAKGFSTEDSLFSSSKYTRDIHRTLLEYSAFPEKFLFFEIVFTESIQNENVNLIIPLSKNSNPHLTRLHDNILCTNCVPAINLFQKKSEPLIVTHEDEEYKLIPNHNDDNFEVHSVEKIYEYDSQSTNGKREYANYFGFSNTENSKFYYVKQKLSNKGGTDTYISFIDANMNVEQINTSTVFADLLCTNRLEAHDINVNSHFHVYNIDGVYCQNLIQPTKPEYPNNGKALWNIVSNLALNHVDLAVNTDQIVTLQKMFEIYNLRSDIAQYSKSIIKIEYDESAVRHPQFATSVVPKVTFKLFVNSYTSEIFMLSLILGNIIIEARPFNTLIEIILFKISDPKIPWKKIELKL
ncbi:MAG: type VI secretion system baseplate subunit TssF [Alphaproteobacteria bacterium]|nr:MAG: type VI secretion system baseplate subunit TssF [Alphaproteobacteria bacterium]